MAPSNDRGRTGERPDTHRHQHRRAAPALLGRRRAGDGRRGVHGEEGRGRAEGQRVHAARCARRAREDRRGRSGQYGVRRPASHRRDLQPRAGRALSPSRLDTDAHPVALGLRGRPQSPRQRRYDAPLHLSARHTRSRDKGPARLARLRAHAQPRYHCALRPRAGSHAGPHHGIARIRMPRFILSRLLSAALVLLGVSCLVFLLLHLVPGDQVEVMLGESAQPADRAALGVAVRIAFPLGVLAAVRRDSAWDYGAMGVSLVGVSMPNFWLGPLLILVFSVWLGWLPVSGRDELSSLVLPAVTLGTALAAILSRMVRASLLEVLHEDFVRTARAKGLPERVVVWHHALRNALLPVVTVLGLQLGVLLGGAVVTEMVFSWPGLGELTTESIQRRDYPVVQACVLLISVSYVLVNTLTDLVYAWLDPRVRLGTDT